MSVSQQHPAAMAAKPNTSVACIINICPVGCFSRAGRQELISLDLRESWTPELFERLTRATIEPMLDGDSFDVFIRHSPLASGYYRYLSPFCLAVPSTVSNAFSSKTSEKTPSLEVEVWRKSDINSPAHVYKRNDAVYPIRQAVECTQVVSSKFNTDAVTSASPVKGVESLKFAVPLATAQCLRAFRRDLNHRILRAANVGADKAYSVEVSFKRSSLAISEKKSSKDLFEAHVAECVVSNKPVLIHYALRHNKMRKEITLRPAVFKQVTPSPSVVNKQPSTQSPSPGFKVLDARSNVLQETACLAKLPASVNSRAASKANGMDPISPSSVATNSQPYAGAPRVLPHQQHSAAIQATHSLQDGFLEALQSLSNVVTPSGPRETMIGSSAPSVMPAGSLPGFSAGKEGSIKEAVKDTVGLLQRALEDVRSNYSAALLDNVGDAAISPKIREYSTPQAASRSVDPPDFKDETKPSEKIGQATMDAKPLKHNATCNLCHMRITGVRWKCAACVDVDVCSSCKPSTPNTHPYHSWIKLTQNDAVPSCVRPSNWVPHRRIICDGCDSPIVGPRFKCISCPDFDWCHGCEADPATHHGPIGGDVPHLFLKIDKPLQADRVRSVCERAQTTSKALSAVESSASDNRTIYVDIDLPNPHRRRKHAGPSCSSAKSNDIICPMPGSFNNAIQTSVNAHTVHEEQVDEGDRSTTVGVAEVAQRVSRIEETLLRFEAKIDDILGLVTSQTTVAALMTAPRVETSIDMPESTEQIEPLVVGTMGATQAQSATLPTEETAEETARALPAQLAVSPKTERLSVAHVLNTQPEQVHDASDEMEEYDMKLEADITVPDGTKFVSGVCFDKVWRVRNCGLKAWPKETQIAAVGQWASEPSFSHLPIALGKVVQPGETMDICVDDLHAQDSEGRQTFFFRLALPRMPPHTAATAPPRLFGDQLWCQIEVFDSNKSSALGSTTLSSQLMTRASSSAANPSADEQSPRSDQHGDQKEQDGLTDSSFFCAPTAPESVASTGERHVPSVLQTPSIERASMIGDDQSVDEHDDIVLLGSDDEFEIVEPTSEDESDAAGF